MERSETPRIEEPLSTQARLSAEMHRLRRDYSEFYDQYDALIGLLCLSAHEGIKASVEEEYRNRRAYFTQSYGQIKKSLDCHLAADPSDCYPTLRGAHSCDAFEAHFMPETIAAMLEADNGCLIGRMMRTLEALGAWDAALAAQEKANGIVSPSLTSPFQTRSSYRH